MQSQFRLFRRRARRGFVYYLQDDASGKQESLKTTSREEAKRILQAREQAVAHPLLNRELAKTYLKDADPLLVARTWESVMVELSSRGGESTRARYQRAIKGKTFDLIRQKTLVETTTEDFLNILKAGTSTTNHYLRRLHNLALGLGWLLTPVLAAKQWQPVKWKQKRAITWEEHQNRPKRIEPGTEALLRIALGNRSGADRRRHAHS